MRSPSPLRLPLLLVGFLLPCLPLQARGDLLLLGSTPGERATDLWQIIEQGRLPGRPLALITGFADEAQAGEELLRAAEARVGSGGAVAVALPDTAAQAGAVAQQLRTCGGVLLAVADAERIAPALLGADGSPTPVLEALRALYAEGAIVAGAGAGAALLADSMIVAGSSSAALRQGASSLGTAGATITPGLGFFEGGLVDPGQDTAGRLGRLIIATQASGYLLGFGLDEAAALHIDPQQGTATSLGHGGVSVVDVSGMTRHPDHTCSGVVLHCLGRGDSFHLVSGAVIPADGREEIANGELPAAPVRSASVWAPGETWRLAMTLVDTQNTPYARGNDGDLDVLFVRTFGTRAWRGTDAGGLRTWTVENLSLAVVQRGALPPAEPAMSAAIAHP